MVALKNERRVYMWHVVPRAVPKEGPAVTIDEILAILKGHYAAGDAEIYLSDAGRVLDDDASAADKDPKNRVYIADLSDDADHITFLINRGDTNAADPAFINVKSNDVHIVAPEDDETQGWSAHLVIAKKKKRDSDAFRACFERMPHANSYYAEQLLRTILERHAAKDKKYTFEKAARRGGKTVMETHRYRPSLSVKKVPSEQIKEDIKNGELSSITLIKTNAKTGGLDTADIIQSTTHKLVLKPKKVEQSRVVAFVEKTVRPWALKDGYTEIQLGIKNLPGNVSASPRFLLEQEDAAETLYARSQRLEGFGTLLENCYAKIESEIQKKMISLISNNEKW